MRSCRRCGASAANPPPSLRAKRSNPGRLCGEILDCFVARAPRNDVCGESPPHVTALTT
ncbi:hypothetical protein GPL20_31755 [Bradyrhizobium cajani]|uniref:Uncharacterized protein n=1 Tax=Bradyrhizobium cajani TaxID=1928661 RepID=A0A844TEK4_9BRAD|nr:hypothetical protein [Bradyrhizobium cajani]